MQNSKNNPSLTINTLSNWSYLGVNAAVAFLLTPYLIHSLGMKNYGIWVLITAVIGYYGLLDLGIRSAIMRYIATYAGKRNLSALNGVFNTGFAIFCVVGAIIIVFSLSAAGFLATFFDISPAKQTEFRLLVKLLGVSTGILFPCNVLAVTLLAHERFVVVNAIRTFLTLFRTSGILWALSVNGGLVSIALVYLLTSICEIVVNLITIRKCLPYIRFSMRIATIGCMGALLHFGLFAFIAKIGELLRLKLDAAVVAKFLDMENVAIYGLATLIIMFLLRWMVALIGTTQPRLASLAARSSPQELSQAITRYSVLIANFMAVLGVTTILLSGDFLRLWVPENVKDPSGANIVLLILVVGLAPDLMTRVSTNALQAVKKHPFYAYLTIVEGLVNLGLSIALVKHLGIYGVALGTAIPAVFTRIIIQPLYCCRVFGLKWRSYMLEVLLKPLSLLATGVTLRYGTSHILVATSYPQLLLKATVVFCLFAVSAYVFCLGQEPRRIVRAKGSAIYQALYTMAKTKLATQKP